jgi:hypothetical protein
MALADLIPSDGVVLDLGASSRKQVLQSRADLAARETGLNASTIFDAVLQRERLGSTGVGQGVSIVESGIEIAGFGLQARGIDIGLQGKRRGAGRQCGGQKEGTQHGASPGIELPGDITAADLNP